MISVAGHIFMEKLFLGLFDSVYVVLSRWAEAFHKDCGFVSGGVKVVRCVGWDVEACACCDVFLFVSDKESAFSFKDVSHLLVGVAVGWCGDVGLHFELHHHGFLTIDQDYAMSTSYGFKLGSILNSKCLHWNQGISVAVDIYSL